MKLNEFVKRLTEGKEWAKYTFPECGFGSSAIREMVMGHMRERRRKRKDTDILKGQLVMAESSNGDTESVESESSLAGSSPPSYKKIKMFTDYFHPGKFSVSFSFIHPRGRATPFIHTSYAHAVYVTPKGVIVFLPVCQILVWNLV